MINNKEFADRLRMIMNHYQLSASAFAERIQVQRSSISHLLSGRNKPSLDFVMRVVKEFDEVELYWLLNGKGKFPMSNETSENVIAPSPPRKSGEATRVNQSLSTTESVKSQLPGDPGIERIVVFYQDGTFKAYTP